MKVKAKLPDQFEEVDIALPIYRKHDVPGNSDAVIYTCISADLRAFEVELRSFGSERTAEISIDDRFDFDSRTDADFTAGKGRYASSETEFFEAVKRARELLDEISQRRVVK